MKRLLTFALLCYAPLVWAEDRLCPDVDTLREQAPDTMSGVQADIDRMRLCVERAKLLKQLDELAKQRQDILRKTVKPDNSSSANPPNMLVPIPALPAAALPTLERAAEKEPSAAPIAPAAAPTPAWAVRKIWGQNDVMHAQLSDGDGGLLNVVQGDVLPDGAMVQNLSARGVSVLQAGKSKELPWEQESVKK